MKLSQTIAIITGPFGCLPPHAIGAIEKRWFSVGEHWRDEGYNICYCSKSPNNISYTANNHVYVKGYQRTGNKVFDFVLDFVYSYKALKRIPTCDIVIINCIWGPILYPLFKRKFGGALYNVARYPKRQMGLYKNIDCLACVSAPIAKAVISQSPQIKDKVCVVSNPIDTYIYNKEGKRNISQEPLIVYTGRVHQEKGLDILVKAISELKRRYNVRLKIIGATIIEEGGSGKEYVDYLNSLASNWNIEWMEPIYTPTELAAEMNKGDIYCYPSVAEKGESFGCAPLEAMGLGLPTIVSDLDCFKDFVDKGENGMVFNHRSDNAYKELANCIEILLNDKELYAKLSEGGIHTSKRFSVESIADQYMTILNKILNHASVND